MPIWRRSSLLPIGRLLLLLNYHDSTFHCIHAWMPPLSTTSSFRAATIQRDDGGSSSSTSTTSRSRLFSTPAGKDSALTTSRVPLTRIFNGEREYLFTTKRNVRNFEWTTSEIEDLFESILTLDEDSQDDELELNAITILPSTMDDEYRLRIGRTSQIYDVHDGQQRLVTLCLLLAALRDKLLEWDANPPINHDDNDKQQASQSQSSSYYYDDDAREVSRAIFPVKSRLDHVTRITLRDKHGKWLRRILSKREDDGKAISKLQFPKARDRKQYLQASELLIIQAYEYCYKRIDDLGPTISLEVLLENFMSKVYLLICIPANTRIARNIVMGLGKGKNMEAVDEFKGMVCFNSIKSETRQDEILGEWNRLCEDVGRNVVEKACLLLAKLYLRKPLKRNGEVDLMEVFLKQYMDDQNNSNNNNNNNNNGSNNSYDGGDIFQDQIVPLSRMLHTIGDFGMEFITVSKGSGVATTTTKKRKSNGGTSSSTKGNNNNNNNNDWPSINFLWSACTTVATAKEMEIPIVSLLLDWQSSMDTNHRLRIQRQLRQLETLTLWMMLAQPKPTPAKRLKRCFEIVDYCESSSSRTESNNNHKALESGKAASSDNSNSDNPLELTDREKMSLYQILNDFEFGSSPTRANVAKIILDRLNESVLLRSSQGRVTPLEATLQLEHVLPQRYEKTWLVVKNNDKTSPSSSSSSWTTADANEWVHRLGNLALLNQKVNAKISNGVFSKKKEHLEDSPYPLTRHIGKQTKWDVDAVQRHHKGVLTLAATVWGLSSSSLPNPPKDDEKEKKEDDESGHQVSSSASLKNNTTTISSNIVDNA